MDVGVRWESKIGKGTRVIEDGVKKQVMERVKRYRQGMTNKQYRRNYRTVKTKSRIQC